MASQQRYLGTLLALALANGACARAVAPEPEAKASAQLFEFQSDFWVNLHQDLMMEVRWRRPGSRAAKPEAASSPEMETWPEWQQALRHYKERFSQRWLFDEELLQIDQRLAAAGSAPDLQTSGLPAELVSVLERAAIPYRRHWERQDRANRQWIESVQPLLQKWGGAMSADLARLYQAPWPTTPVRVEVSGQAGPFGAYTTAQPALITLTSTDPLYSGQASLEMLFHEASHTGPIFGIEQFLERECSARKKDCGDLWHAVLFYTVGEVAQRHLGPDYVPYATRSGVFERGLGRYHPLLVQFWRPYLEGRAEFQAALTQLVESL
jgi:hypothetical protein